MGANLNFQDWFLANLSLAQSRKSEEWSVIFAVTAWWLWRWRNERCFNSEPKIPLDQCAFISARVGEIVKAMSSDLMEVVDHKRKRVERYVRWPYPREGWVRLNTDGAAKGNPGIAGAGGLIRGHRGELFEMFASNCGVCSCTKAELLAVLRGLAIAWNGGHRRVQLTVDSEVVVRLLLEAFPANSPYIHIIRKCKALICRPEWKVTVSHCYREANRAADWLANFGVSLDQRLLVLEAVPGDLQTVLLEDLRGLAHARMVPDPTE